MQPPPQFTITFCDIIKEGEKTEQMDKIAITCVAISREGRGSRHHHKDMKTH